jgi:hypothetical protein
MTADDYLAFKKRWDEDGLDSFFRGFGKQEK